MRMRLLSHDIKPGLIVVHCSGLLCEVLAGPEWRAVRDKPDIRVYKMQVRVLHQLEPYRTYNRTTHRDHEGDVPPWCVAMRENFPPGSTFWGKRSLFRLAEERDRLKDLEVGPDLDPAPF